MAQARAQAAGYVALAAAIFLAACGGGSSETSTPTTPPVTPPTNIVVAVSPTLAAVTTGQSQQFTATLTNTTSTSVSWSVDGTAGGSASVGTITAGGLYAPPVTAGSHTVTATSTVDTTKSSSGTIAVTDLAGVFTRHGDGARTGQNLQEYALTPTLVGSAGSFGKLFQCAIDGSAYAQPLYVANLAIAGGVHNVVFVATENDSVYAFDADASPCLTYWHESFVNGTSVVPVPASIPYQSSLLANWDILHEIGITGHRLFLQHALCGRQDPGDGSEQQHHLS
jgi:hypothetical protein